MQKTNVVVSIIGALVGLFAGYLIWGSTPHGAPLMSKGSHTMPDGTMMNNDGSDMSSAMMDMNAALRGKTGDAFDQAFLSEMIVHHQGAIDMATLALTNANHQELKDLAKAIIAAQTGEIVKMKSWQKNWSTK